MDEFATLLIKMPVRILFTHCELKKPHDFLSTSDLLYIHYIIITGVIPYFPY